MATATRKSTQPPNVAHLRLNAEQAGETILLAIVRRDAEWPTAVEWLTLDALNWDKDTVRRAIGRTKSRMRWQEVAETASDRERAEETLAEARRVLAKEGPVIQKEIDSLQKTLTALENAVAHREQAVRERTEAVRHVAKLLPAFVRRSVDRGTEALRREYRTTPAFQRRVARLGFLRGFVTYRLEQPVDPAEDHEANKEADEIRKYLAKHKLTVRDWPAEKANLQQELEEMETEHARTEEQFAKAVADIEDNAIAPYID